LPGAVLLLGGFVLIRHGQTELNIAARITASLPNTELREARLAAERDKKQKPK